ncbi:MAG: hypothetical protein R8G34_14990 [Paracoccaceae bacterium]|nr:hypothetical protein [Paracoccaceae bacterium]
MPTRKELLEDLNANVEGLSGEILDGVEAYTASADRISEASETFELTVNGMRVALDDAAEKHGRSLERAANDVAGGLIVSSVINVAGAAIGGLFKLALDRQKEAVQRIQIIDSVVKLHDTHGPMDYDFLVQRSYAQDTGKKKRRTLINGLIFEGILYEEEVDGVMKVLVDDDSDALEAHWDWIDALADMHAELENNS